MIAAIYFFIVSYVGLIKKREFYLKVVFSMIVTSGIVLLNLTIWDEVFFLILTLLMLRRFKGIAQNEVSITKITFFDFIFYTFIGYMIFQSVRGVIEFSDFQKARWILFFVLLGLFNKRSSVIQNNFSENDLLVRTIVIASIVYFLFFDFVGLFYEFGLGLNRFDFQPGHARPLLFGSSAYTMFPIVISAPAAFILMRSKIKKHSRLAWALTIILLFTSFYFESRSSIIAIGLFYLSQIGGKKIKPLILVIIIASLFFSLFSQMGMREFSSVNRFSEELYKPFLIFSDNYQLEDVDRWVHIKIAIMPLMKDAFHFFFGYGFRTSGQIIGPYFYDLMRIYDPNKTMAFQDVNNLGTEAFTSLLVETGMVGLALFLSLLFVNLRAIYKEENLDNKITFYLIPVVIFFWFFVINVIDIILLYLLLAPKGILFELIKTQTSGEK